MSSDWKIRDVFNYNRYEINFKIGELVKVTITNPDGSNGEALWIKITEATGEMETKTFPNGFTREGCGNTHFKGELDSLPIEPIYPKVGETIEFNIGHIIRRME